MRILTFSSTAGATTSVELDRDVDVIQVYGVTGGAVLSTDPALTYAAYLAPSVDSVEQTTKIPAFSFPGRYRFEKGSKLYCAPAAGAGVVMVAVEDVIPAG